MTTLASTPNGSSRKGSLPASTLRRRALIAMLLGCVAAVIAALTVHTWLNTDAAQPLAAAVVFVVMSAIVVMTIGDHHPFVRFGPANHVTLIRTVFVSVAASLLMEPVSAALAWVVILLTAIITILDGVDGWFARRTGLSSPFGARFDMETDAFFMLVLCALVWRHGKAGPWVIGIGLMRYAFVVAGWGLPWLAQPLRPTLRGKTVAIAQLVALAFSLVPQVPVPVSAGVCAVALSLLAWSFAVDVRHLWNTRPAR